MIKKGVVMYGVQPEMVMCHLVVQGIFNEFNQTCRVTSVVGKEHKKYSLHPVGFAIDYGTKQIQDGLLTKRVDILMALVDDLKTALPQCDILLEYLNGEQEHIHIEFDPKDDPAFQRAKEMYRNTGKWSR